MRFATFFRCVSLFRYFMNPSIKMGLLLFICLVYNLFLCLMDVRILEILNCLRLNIFLGQPRLVKSLKILIRLFRLQLCCISGLLSF